MSKYQEALDNLWESQDENHSLYYSKSVLQDLVKKATPKKPNLVSNYHSSLVVECPYCYSIFSPRTFMGEIQWKGCPFCLQALDWSDDEWQTK